MDRVKIILDTGIEKEVDCIFFLYNSKYYFVYTDKELDENGYVILYGMQVGKEVQNTASGPINTGYMVGVEINDSEEWKDVVTQLVNDKKNNNQDSKIQYLPMSMLSALKVVTKKSFRLKKSIIEDDFKLNLNTSDDNVNINTASQVVEDNNVSSVDLVANSQNAFYENNSLNNLSQENPEHIIQEPTIDKVESTESTNSDTQLDNDVIIDYRTKFFEEQEKNKELSAEIDKLNQKIEDIKKIIL